MPEGSAQQPELMSKIKIGALVGAGIILLCFLVINLFAECRLSLWPLTSWSGIAMPGTLFIFIFVVIGFGIGFGSCFAWLRGSRLGKAVDMLTEADGSPAEGSGEKIEAEPGEKAGNVPSGN
jgi:hypothetical protein